MNPHLPYWTGETWHKVIKTERRGVLRVVTPIYEVVSNPDAPLMLHARDGRIYACGHNFVSDGGSIPTFFQTLRLPGVSLRRDAFLKSFFLHDFGCLMRGLFIVHGGDWKFRNLSRQRIDQLLYEGLLAEGANKAERGMIFGFVRMYSSVCVNW